MNTRIYPQALEECVLTRAQLRRGGFVDKDIRDAVAAQSLVRIRPGHFVRDRDWREAPAERRHLLAMVSLQRATRHTEPNATAGGERALDPHVFSHYSAATLHGLPVWSMWLKPPRKRFADFDELILHTTVSATGHAKRARHWTRHRTRLAATDIVEIAGFQCTDLASTLIDLAKVAPFPIALACADAVVRRLCVRSRAEFDQGGLERWREEMRDHLARRGAGPGSRSAHAMIELADPRAESPLESVSRLRLLQLGIVPRIQVPVRGMQAGSLYYLDFVLDELGVFGECDGKVKYTDPAVRGEPTAEEIVVAEKRRHDWVSSTTGWRGMRWGAGEVVTLERFARYVRACGLTVPGRPTLQYGARMAAHLATIT